MTREFFRRLFDTLGLSADFDPVIAQNIDSLKFNEKTRETIFLKAAAVEGLPSNKTSDKLEPWERVPS